MTLECGEEQFVIPGDFYAMDERRTHLFAAADIGEETLCTANGKLVSSFDKRELQLRFNETFMASSCLGHVSLGGGVCFTFCINDTQYSPIHQYCVQKVCPEARPVYYEQEHRCISVADARVLRISGLNYTKYFSTIFETYDLVCVNGVPHTQGYGCSC